MSLLRLTLVGLVLSLLLPVKSLRADEKELRAQRVFGLMWAQPMTSQAGEIPEILSPRWKSQEFSTPLFHPANGMIYLGGHDGIMRAMSLQRQQIWQFKAGGPISSVPVVGKRWLYFGADDATLYALDPDNGQKGWTLQADAEIAGQVKLRGDKLYFTTALDSLYCVNAESGEYLWHLKHPQPMSISIAGNADPALGLMYNAKGEKIELVSQACADGSVALVEANSGRELWRRKVGQGKAFFDIDADPVMTPKRIVVAAYRGGVSSLDPHNGQLQWHLDVDGLSALSRQGHVLVGAGDRLAVGIDLATGTLLWRLKLNKGVASKPLLNTKYALINVDGGPLYVLDLLTGEPRQVFGSALGMCGRPDLHGDLLLLHSKSGWIYALSSAFSGWAQQAQR